MKITKRHLKRIIREEYTRILKEMDGGPGVPPPMVPAPKTPEEAQEMVDYLIFAIDDAPEHLYGNIDGLYDYLRGMSISVGGKVLTPTEAEIEEALEYA